MYPAHLGTGQTIALDPVDDGPSLAYSHEFIADRLEQTNLYSYVTGNPTNYVDPSGLKKICGFYVWFYTGLGWCVEENVYYAAFAAAGDVVNCWWKCEVTTHKCVAGKALAVTEVVSGTMGLAGARIPKNPLKFLFGFGRLSPRGGFVGSTPYTSLSRVLGRRVGREELGKAIGRAKITAVAKGVFVVTMVLEAGISIKCGWNCRK